LKEFKAHHLVSKAFVVTLIKAHRISKSEKILNFQNVHNMDHHP